MKLFFVPLSFVIILSGMMSSRSLPSMAKCKPLQVELSDTTRVIRLFVALCDNDSQGIIPVPKKVGNGKDARNNLYWGNENGVRSCFMHSDDWDILDTIKNPSADVAERCIWKHRRYGVFLIADAYWGGRIKNCTFDFLQNASGHSDEKISADQHGKQINLDAGSAALVCYLGHDGLMDFDIPDPPPQNGATKKEVIVLAPASRLYFHDAVAASGARPLLWTTNLMTPGGTTLKAALDGWMTGEPAEKVRQRAILAYEAQMKCGDAIAQNIFATGY